MLTKNLVWLLLVLVLGGFVAFAVLSGDAPPEDTPAQARRPRVPSPDVEPAPEKRTQDSSRVAGNAPARPDAPEPVWVEQAVGLLPPDTLFVMYTDSPSALVSELGLAGLLDRHGDSLREAEDELARVGLTLRDLLDPTGIGLDPAEPATVAIIGMEHPVVVAAARVANQAALDLAFQTFCAGLSVNVREEPMNDAVVFVEDHPSPRLALVQRGGFAYALAGDSRRSDVMTAAAQIAWQELEDGLPTTQAWTESVSYIQGGSLGRVFVNGPALYTLGRLSMQRSHEQEKQWWTDGQGQGDPPEWIERSHATQDALFEAFFGGLGGAAAGFDSEHGAVTVEGRAALEPDSLLRQLFRNRTRESALQRALDVQPVFLLDGALDRAGLMQLAALIGGVAAGEDFERMLAIARAYLGIEGHPVEVLNGELGIAVTLETPPDGEGAPTWGFAFTAGLANTQAVDKVFEALSALSLLSGLVRHDPDTGGLRIDTPYWRTIHIRRVGDTLVATTEERILDNLTHGGGRLGRAYDRADVSRMVTSEGDVGTLLFDFAMMTPVFDSPMYQYAKAPMPHVEDPVAREIAELDAEVMRIERASSQRGREAGLALINLAGRMAATGRLDGDAVTLRGALFHEAGTLQDLAAALADVAASRARDARLRESELQPLWQRRAALQSRLAAATDPPAPLLE